MNVTFITAISILTIIHLALLYFGLAGISTTFTLYIILCYLLIVISNNLITTHFRQKQNIRILIISLCISFFALECTIKYSLKYNLTYSEQNGDYFYTSPYKTIIYQNTIKKYFYNQKNLWLYITKLNYVKTKKKSEFTYSRHYNSLGLRGPDPDTSSKMYNILALGDSFTEGVGVSEDSTWLRLFIKMLKKDNVACNYQGINSAISGSDLFYEFIKLRDLLLQYNPKAVILSINSSDIFDLHIRGGFNRFKKGGKVSYNSSPWWEPLYATSFIFRFVVNDILKNHQLSGIINNQEEENISRIICSCITEYYLPLAKKNGFSLIVVFHPLLNEINQESKILKICASKFEKYKEIKTIDMFEAWNTQVIVNKVELNDIYWPKDQHHKPYGHYLWAKMMHNILSEELRCN